MVLNIFYVEIIFVSGCKYFFSRFIFVSGCGRGVGIWFSDSDGRGFRL